MNDMTLPPASGLGPQSGSLMPRAPLPVRVAIRLASEAFPGALANMIFGRMFTPPRRKMPAIPLPEGGRHQTVKSGDLDLAVWMWEGHGPAVLLVHGWGGSARSWSPAVDALRKIGAKVVVFDLPAHGQSGGATADVASMAAAIGAVIGAIGAPDVVIGHSMGAAATVEYFCNPRNRCRKLVLIAPGGDLPSELELMSQASGLSSRAVLALKRRLERRFARPLKECSVVHALAAVTADVHLIHDRQDRVIPADVSRRIMQEKPGATLLETQGLGHFKILADPAVHRLIAGICAGVEAPAQA